MPCTPIAMAPGDFEVWADGPIGWHVVPPEGVQVGNADVRYFLGRPDVLNIKYPGDGGWNCVLQYDNLLCVSLPTGDALLILDYTQSASTISLSLSFYSATLQADRTTGKNLVPPYLSWSGLPVVLAPQGGGAVLVIHEIASSHQQWYGVIELMKESNGSTLFERGLLSTQTPPDIFPITATALGAPGHVADAVTIATSQPQRFDVNLRPDLPEQWINFPSGYHYLPSVVHVALQLEGVDCTTIESIGAGASFYPSANTLSHLPADIDPASPYEVVLEFAPAHAGFNYEDLRITLGPNADGSVLHCSGYAAVMKDSKMSNAPLLRKGPERSMPNF